MKKLMHKRSARFVALFAIVAVFSAMAANAETTPIGATDLESITTALTSQISVTTVVGILAAGATAAVGFVFMWWGARKLLSMLMAAFKKGKVKI